MLFPSCSLALWTAKPTGLQCFARCLSEEWNESRCCSLPGPPRRSSSSDSDLLSTYCAEHGPNALGVPSHWILIVLLLGRDCCCWLTGLAVCPRLYKEVESGFIHFLSLHIGSQSKRNVVIGREIGFIINENTHIFLLRGRKLLRVWGNILKLKNHLRDKLLLFDVVYP